MGVLVCELALLFSKPYLTQGVLLGILVGQLISFAMFVIDFVL